MPIIQNIQILKSVGVLGRNDRADVLAVQKQLNAQMHPPRVALVEDGKNGRKTEAMIKDFQKSVLGMRNPDGRIDPGGKTLRALNDPASEGIWARMTMMPTGPVHGPQPAPGSVGGAAGSAPPMPTLPNSLSPAEKAQFEKVWNAVATDPAVKRLSQAQAFMFLWLSELVSVEIQWIKNALNVQSGLFEAVLRAQRLELLVKGVHDLNTIRMSRLDTLKTLSEIHKRSGKDGLLRFCGALDSQHRLGRALGKLGKPLLVLGIAITALEVADCFKKGQYGKGAGEIYKLVMGIAVPWAALIDVLQSLIVLIDPSLDADKNKKTKQFFAMIKHANPLAAGAVYIDTYVTVIEGIIKLDLNQARFEALDKRIAESPLAIYREMGNHLGDWIGDLTGQWIYDNILKHI